MAAFEYLALDHAGKQKKGVMEGDSQRQIRQNLRETGLIPLAVEPVNQHSTQKNAAKVNFIGFRLGGGPTVNVRDLALITRQMATLIQAGLPIEEVLGAVSQQTEKPKVRNILMAVRSKVLEGFSLAEGFGEFPRAFPKLYRATVSAGEHSGHLDLVMNRLADYTESSHATKRSITAALVYPAILLLVSIVIVIFLMTSVVPGVISVFANTKQNLPVLTVVLVAVSNFFAKYTPLLVAAILAAVAGTNYSLRNDDLRMRVHHRLLDIPMVGKLLCTINTARFASTLSILTSSGVALVDAMKIAGEVLSNDWLRLRVANATRSVSEGSSLKNALEQAGYFSPMMLHMIASGESSGELDTMLDRTAKAQELDLNNFISVMVSLIPPLIILFMGGMVFMIVLAILLPIFQLNQLVS
jgi:general secretion pathway protein F